MIVLYNNYNNIDNFGALWGLDEKVFSFEKGLIPVAPI